MGNYCSEFEEAVKSGFIVKNVYSNKTQFCIRGKPDLLDDGDGFIDDMTGEIEITHCPFCGEELLQ